MPGSKRLIDILDEMNLKENEVLNKFGRLLRLMESYNPPMDDPELRWVEGQIDKLLRRASRVDDDVHQVHHHRHQEDERHVMHRAPGIHRLDYVPIRLEFILKPQFSHCWCRELK